LGLAEPAKGTKPMNVKELREALEEAEGILAAAGAKSRSKDFRSFLDLLNGHDERPVKEFLADLRHRLNGSQTAPPKSSKQLNEQVVIGYIERLRDASINRTSFDRVFAELTKDKSVRKNEADAIAHRYTGGREKWPKKSDALRAIADWFTHEAYQAVKMKQVDKATPV
jgi:hypothetical protein